MSGQTQIAITPVKDNTLFEDSTGSLSSGSGDYIFAGRTSPTNQGLIRRALVAFDVAGNIPPGATVMSAALTLTASMAQPSGPTVTLHRVLSDWGQGSSNGGSGGGGAPSTSNDATWIHTFFDTDFWNTPGGDFVSTPSASQTIVSPGQYTWGSTAEMVTDVQRWLDSSSTNFGWLLRGDEGSTQTAKRFNSSEHADTATRPILTIIYTPVVGVDVGQEIPHSFALNQNYPNPFNPSTVIRYSLHEYGHARLVVYNLIGQPVATLVDEVQSAGFKTVVFDAADLPSGVYFYSLAAGPFRETKKFVLLK
jgi:hypothetical protein